MYCEPARRSLYKSSTRALEYRSYKPHGLIRIQLFSMVKLLFIAAILLSLQLCNAASVKTLNIKDAERLTLAPCHELAIVSRDLHVDTPLEVRQAIQKVVRSCFPPPPPPPPPTRCPCKCTSYAEALKQCKGYSFSQCWLIGPPKCKKGQLSCCC